MWLLDDGRPAEEHQGHDGHDPGERAGECPVRSEERPERQGLHDLVGSRELADKNGSQAQGAECRRRQMPRTPDQTVRSDQVATVAQPCPSHGTRRPSPFDLTQPSGRSYAVFLARGPASILRLQGTESVTLVQTTV